MKLFLDKLPPNSRVLDIGCGNGKNMLYGAQKKDLQMYGLEQSRPLTEICINQGLNVVQGDALHLPFDNESFDAIIIIAVIHHINPLEHNKVLREIERVLKPNAQCLMTNWAVEQPEGARRQFIRGLNMVLWKGKEDNPLPYWVMDKELALEFINNLPDGLEFMNLDWEAGNFNFTLQKHT